MIISEFSHWTLAVRDLETSSRFYRDVMAWRQTSAASLSDDDGWGPIPDREGIPTSSRRFLRDRQRIELISLPDGTQLRDDTRPEVHHVGLSHMTVPTGPAESVMQRLLDAGITVRTHTLASFIA